MYLFGTTMGATSELAVCVCVCVSGRGRKGVVLLLCPVFQSGPCNWLGFGVGLGLFLVWFGILKIA